MPAPEYLDEQEEESETLISEGPGLSIEEPLVSVGKQDPENLLSLEEAIEKIPESLRAEMKELLRAEFREVRLWTEGTRHS